jgi:peroxiredoxin
LSPRIQVWAGARNKAANVQTHSLEEAFRHNRDREGPLNGRLTDFSAAVRVYGPAFAEAYDDLVARLKSEQAGRAAPRSGDRMPSFLLPDKDGRLLDMHDLIADGPAVISFNRGHWCEYCAIELSALQQGMEEISARGANAVAIIPEGPGLTSKVSGRIGGAFKILSDFDSSYSRSLGLAIWLGERVRELYLAHGLRLHKYQGNDAWFVPIAATYVVGQDSKILACHVDVDFRNRMEIGDILAALER